MHVYDKNQDHQEQYKNFKNQDYMWCIYMAAMHIARTRMIASYTIKKNLNLIFVKVKNQLQMFDYIVYLLLCLVMIWRYKSEVLKGN